MPSFNMAKALAFAFTLQCAYTAVLPPACPGPTATINSFPEPSTDPFYMVPKNIAKYENGAVIRSRSIASTQQFGSTVNARQIFYRTTNRQGNATGTVTTVFIPDVPAIPPKIFSYQNPEDALDLRCSPSWAITNGTADEESYLSPFIQAFATFSLAQGWYFVTSDDEDRDSEWLVGNTEGRATVDGVRAATSSLCLSDPATVMLGYSGGAHETVWALNQLAEGYANDVNVVGAAFGGTPVDLASNYELLNGGSGSALALGAIVGLSRGYPQLAQTLNTLATPKGKQYLAAVSGPDACIPNAGPGLANQNYSSPAFFKGGNIQNNPVVKSVTSRESLLQNVSPLKVPVPKMPRLEWHGESDVTVPYAAEKEYVGQQCAKGADIRFVSFPGLDHVEAALAGIPGALLFTEQAFSGTLVTTDCGANITLPALGSAAASAILGTQVAKILETIVY